MSQFFHVWMNQSPWERVIIPIIQLVDGGAGQRNGDLRLQLTVSLHELRVPTVGRELERSLRGHPAQPHVFSLKNNLKLSILQIVFFLIGFLLVFRKRERKKDKEIQIPRREKHINRRPPICPTLGIEPVTQPCSLTRI